MAEDCRGAPSTTGSVSAQLSKGPVRILCDEIGFPFDHRFERVDLFVSFVRELVAEIDHARMIAAHVAKMGGKGPSEGSAEVLALARGMTDPVNTIADLRATAEAVHDLAHELNPDEAYPTDHLIDMLSSCASAIRFGLEEPCRSRHAASAADHVWKQIYGVSRFDEHTPEWRKSWARAKLISALVSLLPQDRSPGAHETAREPNTAKGNS